MSKETSQDIVKDSLDEFLYKLDDFLAYQGKSSWIETNLFKVYVRKSIRCVGESFIKCIDLATIEVHPSYRGMGITKSVVGLIERKNPFSAVYVESILNPIAAGILSRRGYKEHGNNSMIKLFPSEKTY